MNWNLPGNSLVTDDAIIGTSGAPKRVFSLHIVATSGGAASVSLFNGTDDTGTERLKLTTSAASKGNTFDAHMGIRFNNGLFLEPNDGNLSYALVVYQEEQ